MRKLRLAPYLIVLLTVATPAFSQSFDLGGLPALTTEQNLDGEVTYSLSLQVLALMTAVTLLPSLVLGMTSFTRIIIVLVYPTSGIRDSANSTKSGAHCHRIVFIIVHYAANAE